jgi:hypothetical protein
VTDGLDALKRLRRPDRALKKTGELCTEKMTHQKAGTHRAEEDRARLRQRSARSGEHMTEQDREEGNENRNSITRPDRIRMDVAPEVFSAVEQRSLGKC